MEEMEGEKAPQVLWIKLNDTLHPLRPLPLLLAPAAPIPHLPVRRLHVVLEMGIGETVGGHLLCCSVGPRWWRDCSKAVGLRDHLPSSHCPQNAQQSILLISPSSSLSHLARWDVKSFEKVLSSGPRKTTPLLRRSIGESSTSSSSEVSSSSISSRG